MSRRLFTVASVLWMPLRITLNSLDARAQRHI
jgi:hypothetical protein